MTSFGNRLRELRKEKGKLQKDIAALLGVTERHYREYEAGRVDAPLSNVMLLADYFNVSIDYLVGRC